MYRFEILRPLLKILMHTTYHLKTFQFAQLKAKVSDEILQIENCECIYSRCFMAIKNLWLFTIQKKTNSEDNIFLIFVKLIANTTTFVLFSMDTARKKLHL